MEENTVMNGTEETGASTQVNNTMDNSGVENKPKTFTQEEVSAMMAKEKNQGRLSILKELGIEDAKTAKEGLKKYNEYIESQKTEVQKLQGETQAEKEARVKAEEKAAFLEIKLEALSVGVKPDCVDDITAIAKLKAVEGQEIKSVIEGLKKKPEYKGFFTESENNTNTNTNGTGNTLNTKRPNTQGDNIGKRLGEKTAQNFNKGKSSFFQN